MSIPKGNGNWVAREFVDTGDYEYVLNDTKGNFTTKEEAIEFIKSYWNPYEYNDSNYYTAYNNETNEKIEYFEYLKERKAQ